MHNAKLYIGYTCVQLVYMRWSSVVKINEKNYIFSAIPHAGATRGPQY